MTNEIKRPRIGAVRILIGMCVFLASCSVNPENAKKAYLESGLQCMNKGKYSEASIEFRRALKIDPRFAEGYFQLAQAFLALKDWQRAYEALASAKELDPSRLDVRLNLARLDLEAKKFREAEKEASFIISNNLHSPPAYQVLGASLLGQKENGKALDAFKKLAEMVPDDVTSYINLGLVHLSLGHPAEAEKNFQKAIQIDPRSEQAYDDLGNFYRAQGRASKAEEILQKGVENIPDGFSLYTNWAAVLYGEHEEEAGDDVIGSLRNRNRNSPTVAQVIGDFYVQHNDSNRALAEYRRGLQLDPHNVELNERMIDQYLASGHVQEAKLLNAIIFAKDPTNVAANVAKARISMADGHIENAISELRQQLVQNMNSPEVHYYLGLALWEKGELAQAKTELRLATELDPGNSRVLLSLARLHLELGELDAARVFGERAIQPGLPDIQGHALLGNIYLRQKDFAVARKEFNEAVLEAPGEPSLHLGLAQTYVGSGNAAAADKEFDVALRLSPQFDEALAELVDFWVATRRRMQALERVRTFIAYYPSDARGHVILGSLLAQSKDFKTAQDELVRAIQLDPKQVQAYLALGKLYQDRGETDAAIQRYEQALAVQPKMAPLLTLLGNLYLEKGDLPKAQSFFQQALAVDPDFAIAASNLAWVYAKQGTNLDTALKLAQTARGLLPDLDSIADVLGWVEVKRGNYSAAIPLLRECISKAPIYPVYRYHLGMALVESGHRAEGKAELEESLRLKLQGEEASEARSVLSDVK
jgi:tetratricopeptide (TPR) repeat protein